MTDKYRHKTIEELKRIIKDFDTAMQEYMHISPGPEKQKAYAYVMYVIENTFDTLILNDGYHFIKNYCKSESIAFGALYIKLNSPETFHLEATKILDKLLSQKY